MWDGAERATPLFCAAAAEDSRCLAALLAAGADPNLGLHELGISALHCAASNNATKNMELLLQRGATPNSVVLFRYYYYFDSILCTVYSTPVFIVVFLCTVRRRYTLPPAWAMPGQLGYSSTREQVSSRTN